MAPTTPRSSTGIVARLRHAAADRRRQTAIVVEIALVSPGFPRSYT
jgi:hypothetical protein